MSGGTGFVMTPEQRTAALAKLARYERPERVLPYARSIDETMTAALFGVGREDLEAAIAGLDAERAASVAVLAGRTEIRAALAAVPFTGGERLVGLGESTTADRLSWFEVLAALFESERPELGLRFENRAVSGSTTTQAIARLAGSAAPADLVCCMLGANDVRRLGGPDGPRLVSEAETGRNLRVLRAAVPASRWLWVTPTGVDEARIAANPYLGGNGLVWTNADLRRTGELIAEAAEHGDLVVRAEALPGSTGWIDDGLHPDAVTQRELAGLVLQTLAR